MMVAVEERLDFREVAAQSVQGVRRSVERVIARLPEHVMTASDLKRAVGVDYSLCWHLFEILKSEEPLAVAHRVPSLTSLKKFANAAVERGVPTELAEAIPTAAAEFERVVKRHASTRPAFNAMVSALVGEMSADETTLSQRKTAFRVESQLWGAQVSRYFQHTAVFRNEDGTISGTSSNVKIGFQRLRAEVRPVVGGGIVPLTKGVDDPTEAMFLDPETQSLERGFLLPELCSKPLPKIGQFRESSGWTYFVFESDELGRLGAADLTNARRFARHEPRVNREGVRFFASGMRIITPTEYAIFELHVHVPTLGHVVPRMQIIPDAGVNEVDELFAASSQLPMYGKLTELGRANEIAPPSGVPPYPALMEKVYSALGHDAGEYRVYRFAGEYPILRSQATFVLEFGGSGDQPKTERVP